MYEKVDYLRAVFSGTRTCGDQTKGKLLERQCESKRQLIMKDVTGEKEYENGVVR